VLVIEHQHWADQALLEFLVHLLEWTTSVPLLLVATARPELHERVAGWGGGVRNATTIALGPLSDADTAWLLSTLLGRSVMPADTQAILLERAGGNPLYAEEFVRLLADRGLLNPDGDGPGLAEVPAPETVQALIAARLDTLSVERKALLQDAAVVGRVFWSGAVAAMGGIDEPEVRQDLHELARKELVRPARRSSVAGQGEYAFWHLLVRDTAYEQIPRAARAGKHRSAAAWIERLAGERVADHAELLAHHYGQALFLARAARLPGAQLAELEQPARHFLIMAGDRTVNLDVVRAEAYYLKALDLCPSGHAARAAVLVKAAGAAIQTGRLEAAESQLQAAIAASGDREDAVIRGDALLVLAGLLWNQGKTGAGRAALLEAIELLEREQPGRRLASAYAGMAANRLHAGRAQEALAWADRTLGLAGDLGVVELKVRGLRLRGVARCDLGDFGGVEDLRTALELALGQGLGFDAATAANDLAESLWLAEGPVSALDAYRTGITRAERRGIGSAATWSRAETLRPLFDLGRWAELLRTADELRRWSKAHGATYLRVLVDVSCAQVLAHRGELAAAISLSADFLTRARDIGDPQAVVPALSTAALLEQARGARTAALALVEELDQGTRDPGAGHLYRGQYLADLARVCVAAQEPGLAQELLDATQAVAARARHGLLTGRAVVAEARGDLDQAARLYGEAAQRWGGYGHVLERAQAWFGEGRCLLRLGRPQARARLDEAREAFAGLGARLLLAQTDRWLARAATRSS
jgi:tetratricopeptide (TPR) repeat protein